MGGSPNGDHGNETDSTKRGLATMADPASDGAATVTAERFNGLMGSYQKALSMLSPEQRAGIKADPEPAAEADDEVTTEEAQTEDEQADDAEPTEDSQQAEEYEDGIVYVREGGTFRPIDSPTPRRHNEARTRETTDVWDDPYGSRKATSPAGEGYPI